MSADLVDGWWTTRYAYNPSLSKDAGKVDATAARMIELHQMGWTPDGINAADAMKPTSRMAVNDWIALWGDLLDENANLFAKARIPLKEAVAMHHGPTPVPVEELRFLAALLPKPAPPG